MIYMEKSHKNAMNQGRKSGVFCRGVGKKGRAESQEKNIGGGENGAFEG
jgi:hypothetical protein